MGRRVRGVGKIQITKETLGYWNMGPLGQGGGDGSVLWTQLGHGGGMG